MKHKEYVSCQLRLFTHKYWKREKESEREREREREREMPAQTF